MIMLCLRCTLGGAEKRYARVFEMLVSQSKTEHKLLINRELLSLLQRAGILVEHNESLIIIESRRHPVWKILTKVPLLPKVLTVLQYVWHCEQALREHRPTVVHPLLAGTLFSLPALIRHPHVRHVMSAYTSYTLPFASSIDKKVLGLNLRSVVRRWAMQHSDAIDALSTSIAEKLADHGIDRQKITVAPNSFTDISQCQPDSDKKRWVVFSGRLIESKQPNLLIQAAPQVLDEIPDVNFFVLGRGYLKAQLEADISRLDLSDEVTLRFVPQPTQILNQSSIFVSLQIRENYPSQSLLEAMACGNAIIATDVGETWRLVDEENGLRIPATKEALASAIVDLFKDPQLYQKQQASRQRVLSKHTPERFFAHITRVYQQAVRGREN